MIRLIEPADPVREALVHGEAVPSEWRGWPTGEALRRLRLRFGLKKKDLAARAGVSPSLVGRAEKGADIRLSTLRRLYAAVGCRLQILPDGALYDLDRRQAHLDNDYIDWRLANAKYFGSLE